MPLSTYIEFKATVPLIVGSAHITDIDAEADLAVWTDGSWTISAVRVWGTVDREEPGFPMDWIPVEVEPGHWLNDLIAKHLHSPDISRAIEEEIDDHYRAEASERRFVAAE